MQQLQPFILVLVLGATAFIAVSDGRTFQIPNLPCLFLLLLWPLSWGEFQAWQEGIFAFFIAASVFLGGWLLFPSRILGGGDVKFLSVALLWVGPFDLARFLIFCGIGLGMTVSVQLVLFSGWFGFRMSRPRREGAAAMISTPLGVPMGLALILVIGQRLLEG